MSNNELKALSMMSYYPGEPVVGIAKATGKLVICEDEIIFIKQLGNALGSNFGLAGMAIARKKAMNQGSTMRFRYDEIEMARAGQYMGMMPMLVLEMKNEAGNLAWMSSVAMASMLAS